MADRYRLRGGGFIVDISSHPTRQPERVRIGIRRGNAANSRPDPNLPFKGLQLNAFADLDRRAQIRFDVRSDAISRFKTTCTHMGELIDGPIALRCDLDVTLVACNDRYVVAQGDLRCRVHVRCAQCTEPTDRSATAYVGHKSTCIQAISPTGPAHRTYRR